ncbi:MAG: PstS family phosphate ABC transporter substrate-binding protein [Verrucomicrobiota bacterium]
MRYVALLFLLVGLLPLLKAESLPVVMKGSDTLGAKLVPRLIQAYQADGKDLRFEIAAEGSSTAFTHLLEDPTGIGMASRPIKVEERARFEKAGLQLTEHVAAFDMMAIVVHETQPIESLSLRQIESIFTSEVTNWSEVGGADLPIAVYTRNTSSGTYKTFQRLAMRGRPYGETTQKMAGGGLHLHETSKNAAGITYVGLAYTQAEGIKVLEIDNVFPKPENQSIYRLARPLYFYTTARASPEALEFLRWAGDSETAGRIVEQVGFIRVRPDLTSQPMKSK